MSSLDVPVQQSTQDICEPRPNSPKDLHWSFFSLMYVSGHSDYLLCVTYFIHHMYPYSDNIGHIEHEIFGETDRFSNQWTFK